MVYSPIVNAFRQSPEEAGGQPNYMNALKNVFSGLQSAAETAYKPSDLAESLLAKQLQNKHDKIINEFLPRSEQARIGNTEAQTGLIGQQTKYFGPTAQSEIDLRNAQRGLYSAQSQQAAREADLKQKLMDMYFNQGSMPVDNTRTPTPSYQPGQGQPMYAQNMREASLEPMNSDRLNPLDQIRQIQQNNRNSLYGIESPQPSKEDLANKMLFGIDTYGKRQELAQNQIKEQRDQFTKKAAAIDSELEASNKQGQLLDRYNKLMDESFLAGPFGSKVKIPTPQRQQIEAVSRDMILSGIEELKTAMGSARFSNLDLETASARKPDISWSPEARKEYTNRFKAFNERLNERAAFNQIASHPGTGVSSQEADRLWSAYQKHHPIIADAQTLQINKYKPNNWASYLTPEAINSIRQTGDYNPKDKGLVIELNKTEKKIAEKYSLKDLEEKLAEKRRRNKK